MPRLPWASSALRKQRHLHLHILFVGDGPAQDGLVRAALAEAQAPLGLFQGASVETVAALDAAVERVGQRAADLVVVDLPHVGPRGPAAVSSLRRAAPDLPIVALVASRTHRRDAFGYGADECVAESELTTGVLVRSLAYAWTQRELARAQHRTLELGRSIRTARAMAHDLVTKINLVTGYGDLLVHRAAEGPVADLAREMVSAAQEATDVVLRLQKAIRLGETEGGDLTEKDQNQADRRQ